MPNLVGIGNSQVPTNAMLGGLAYQDPAHANLTSVEIENIAAIKAKTTDTAVDVFVYDTRKDSDGGAWRKRTGHTSWYNEGVSATRGTRKEFPVIAVIVATTDTYTIYDGDDPNLSMWMKFESDGSSGARVARSGTSAIAMCNAIMVATRSGSERAAGVASFIEDTAYQISNGGKHQTIGGHDGLVNRNESGSWNNVDTSYIIAGASTFYDVAMTVLPNSPIDPKTGIAFPLIAIATASRVALIIDNSNTKGAKVFEYTDAAGGLSTKVAFTQDGRLAYAHDGSTSIRIDQIKTQDFSYGSNKVAKHNSTEFYINTGLLASGWSGDHPKLLPGSYAGNGEIVAGRDNILLQRNALGLNLLARDFPNQAAANRVCHISDEFNTGWMVGEARGAWLASTDSTDATATNLISNGTFDSNTNGWTASGATLSVVSNRMKIQTDSQGYAYTTVTTVAHKQYVFSFDFADPGNASAWVQIGSTTHGNSGSDIANMNPIGEGQSIGFSFRAKTTTTYLTIKVSTAGSNKEIYVDNCVCELAERDGVEYSGSNSYYAGYGLRVVGTVAKNPVETGADLMAYGPFSSGNYLQHPLNRAGYTTYNKFSDFSTNDFYFMTWIKLTSQTPGHNRSPLAMWNNSTSSPSSDKRCAFYITNSTAEMGLYQQDGGTNTAATAGQYLKNNNRWYHCVWVRRDNGQVDFYLDGHYSMGSAGTLDMSQVMTINIGADRGHPGSNGSCTDMLLSLMKIGKGGLNRAQVLKIYNDERAMFQPNAKCTLYGSSPAITGIAHDTSTDITHVGTSAGRSEFNGLTRINNTTTAVTTAISAENGVVAEQ